ncbi:Histidine kinase-like ATPase domain-containing protein [Streptomyces sp. DvalAA-14]|uniref:ATP-binding protein n=1 Tax=unclassified Streptomyces TaxID=2593676 RepID=UPI00081B5251|nr:MULTISPECIES: ATP-binding protein [unclassified Streptomyces]MYS19094.1 ATP-binding protein [Streptomyces sp. SID4948]SCD36449.1 Histidine kinase-like ATPase domain-containing protein [Streptomyces sp. DvalAA-14]
MTESDPNPSACTESVVTSAAIAREHPTVVVKSWPPTPRSVGRARHLLAGNLDAWGLSHLADSAQLILSELITNSVRHARRPHGRLISTRFERLEHGVRIEVHDASEAEPERREASWDEESGRGLSLVDALTEGRWGVADREDVGKMVWAVCVAWEPGVLPAPVGLDSRRALSR